MTGYPGERDQLHIAKTLVGYFYTNLSRSVNFVIGFLLEANRIPHFSLAPRKPRTLCRGLFYLCSDKLTSTIIDVVKLFCTPQ